MDKNSKAAVLTIAGTDPSGGAGIQADIKAISATGAYAASVITALVAQNTQRVQSIIQLEPHFIKEQLDVVCSDLRIAAVKIGMLYSVAVVEIVAQALKQYPIKHLVLDPVMIAKNGTSLLLDETIAALKQQLLPLVSLITPNIPEAERLLDCRIETKDEMVLAAQRLARDYKTHVLVKGGHGAGAFAEDILYLYDDADSGLDDGKKHTEQIHWFAAPRIETKNTHGTGCTLSAAIASYLSQGFDYVNAVGKAKDYLTAAIKAGATQQIGQGNGPVDHFYFIARHHND